MIHSEQCNRTRGFTLVELSIVLVILGLLVGGVLSGQSLIRAAEIRSITTQLDGYRIAVNGFRDKYFALPGDMRDATRFWGAASTSASATACLNAQTAGSKATCNGNGDGKIIASDTSASAAPGKYSERFTAWKHLANAGLIEGSYTGVNGPAITGSNEYNTRIGENVPAARFARSFYDLYFLETYPTLFYAESPQDYNFITFFSPSLRPEEAWNIDTKLDDGNPVTGNLFSQRKSSGAGATCVTTDIGSTAQYDVVNTSGQCQAMQFKM